MKIFFVASIHGKEKYLKAYQKIVESVQKSGHTIQADHVLNVSKDDLATWDEDKNLKYHKKVLDGIKKADVLFVEMSYPSTSIGYLLAEGVDKSKPVVMFFGGQQAPHLLPTLESYERLQLIQYDQHTDFEKEIQYALEYASDQQDTRFNFFISPKIANYLDWVAKSKRLPRAVYLRRLIEENMNNNEEYKDF